MKEVGYCGCEEVGGHGGEVVGDEFGGTALEGGDDLGGGGG